jgi:hypothetical protein
MDPKKNQRDLPYTPGHCFRPLELPRSYSPVGSRCQTRALDHATVSSLTPWT